MIKISAETREMIMWLFNKFGDRPFTFSEVSDTISPVLFEKFRVNKFIVMDDMYELEHRNVENVPEGWKINWLFVGEVIRRRKYLWH